MPDCDTTTNAGSSNSGGVVTSKETAAKTDKLKVLALHGYRQTGDSFKSKIGSFRKYLNKYVEFVFVTAPHVAPVDGDAPGNSWWFNKDDGSFKGTNKDGPAIGFEKSLRLVEEVWESQGPFQGILGFSQGACFAGILCSLAMRGSKFITLGVYLKPTEANFHIIFSDNNKPSFCSFRRWIPIWELGSPKRIRTKDSNP